MLSLSNALIFLYALFLVTWNILQHGSTYGHPSEAGLHHLAVSYNLTNNLFSPLYDYSFYNNGIIEKSYYNHHPRIAFILFGLISFISVEPVYFLLYSQILSVLTFTIFLLLLEKFLQKLKIRQFVRFICILTIISAPLVTHNILMTNYDAFNLLSSLIYIQSFRSLFKKKSEEKPNFILMLFCSTISIYNLYCSFFYFIAVICFAVRKKELRQMGLLFLQVLVIFGIGLYGMIETFLIRSQIAGSDLVNNGKFSFLEIGPGALELLFSSHFLIYSLPFTILTLVLLHLFYMVFERKKLVFDIVDADVVYGSTAVMLIMLTFCAINLEWTVYHKFPLQYIYLSVLVICALIVNGARHIHLMISLILGLTTVLIVNVDYFQKSQMTKAISGSMLRNVQKLNTNMPVNDDVYKCEELKNAVAKVGSPTLASYGMNSLVGAFLGATRESATSLQIDGYNFHCNKIILKEK